MNSNIEDTLEYLKNKKTIEKLSKNKKEETFFLNCFNDNVSLISIETLVQNMSIYKHLIRNNNLSLNDVIYNIEGNTFNKTFEEFNDNVEKAIIKNKAHKLLRSVTSNKHKHLINEETKELFVTLVQQGITREELENGLMKKIAQFEDAEEFNYSIKNKFINEHNRKNILELAKEYNIPILYEDKNKTIFFVDNAEAMEKIGTNMWCVQRSQDVYNSYTKTGSYFAVTYDFQKKRYNPLALTATIVSAKGKVLDTYDSNDSITTEPTIINLVSEHCKSFGFEEFKERINKRNNNMLTYLDKIHYTIVEGFDSEFNKYLIEDGYEALDGEAYLTTFRDFILREGHHYREVIKDFPIEGQKAVISHLTNEEKPTRMVLEFFLDYMKDENLNQLIKENLKNKTNKVTLKDLDNSESYYAYETKKTTSYYKYFQLLEKALLTQREYNNAINQEDMEQVELLQYVCPNLIKKNAFEKIENAFAFISDEEKIEFYNKYGEDSILVSKYIKENKKDIYIDRFYKEVRGEIIAKELMKNGSLLEELNIEERFNELKPEVVIKGYNTLINRLLNNLNYDERGLIENAKNGFSIFDYYNKEKIYLEHEVFAKYLMLKTKDESFYQSDKLSVKLDDKHDKRFFAKTMIREFAYTEEYIEQDIVARALYELKDKELIEEILNVIEKEESQYGDHFDRDEALAYPETSHQHNYRVIHNLKQSITEHPEYQVILKNNQLLSKKETKKHNRKLR